MQSRPSATTMGGLAGSPNFSRPTQERASRRQSPAAERTSPEPSQRPRQYSQGFFEPTLPALSLNNSSGSNGLSASQIAAQTAMHVQHPPHLRRRSEAAVGLEAAAQGIVSGRRKPLSPPSVPLNSSMSSLLYETGIIGAHKIAATTAANAAYPKSPVLYSASDSGPNMAADQKPTKEKYKKKLFSKPKSINLSKDKDSDRKPAPPLPSPTKGRLNSSSQLSRIVNNSSVSLLDTGPLVTPTLYSGNHASTSTLVPSDRQQMQEKEKDKKHHFLSRQKNKLKEREKDDYHLPLSSVNSISKATDPNDPHPLYSFAAPAVQSHATALSKSVSGLDLRHGGRALRERRKEEKTALATQTLNEVVRGRQNSIAQDRLDLGASPRLGSSHGLSSKGATFPVSVEQLSPAILAELGICFGLPGMTPDDAWPLLKARVMNIFEGEEPRPPIEDFNGLVSAHVRRCINRRTPSVLVEDFRELVGTGFSSLDHSLHNLPDERLVPHLSELWLILLSTVLPFLQAVFLPLDLEFKGRGQLMTAREAAEFWGAVLPGRDGGASRAISVVGEDLDVRRIILISFRDIILLPRNDSLLAIFSRLSLENINIDLDQIPDPSTPLARSGTATGMDPGFASFNSQSSTLLNSAGSGNSVGARSRATSNTSAISFRSAQSQPQNTPMDSARVTEMVGRMLQCICTLASVHTEDEDQAKMERLSKELKYNWLGRGRTGRQRRGFIGNRVPRRALEAIRS